MKRRKAAIGLFSVKMVADRHRHAALYYNKHWRQAFFGNVNISDPE